METFIQNNFLYIFCAVTGIFLVIFIIAKMNSSKNRKILEENSDLIKVTFDEPVYLSRPIDLSGIAGFTVYSVNNAVPNLVDNVLFIEPRKNIINLSYCHEVGGRKSFVTYEKSKIGINAKLGYQYNISFNLIEKKYDIIEKMK